ncbi:hypothetical protein AC578_7346 [Pseudocercospora eumusae]|uniref:Uncharacterized protein n=1 Tax=Pseudocercospora eumusae TaxID=321146 RepID=A0A139HWI7_9PEZI|nr:hypothetical protein AC578_7346 [Pseudocercospora eumusae]
MGKVSEDYRERMLKMAYDKLSDHEKLKQYNREAAARRERERERARVVESGKKKGDGGKASAKAKSEARSEKRVSFSAPVKREWRREAEEEEEDSGDGSDDDDEDEEEDGDEEEEDDDDDDDFIRPYAGQKPYSMEQYGEDATRACQKSAKEGRAFALRSIPLLRSMMSGALGDDTHAKHD